MLQNVQLLCVQPSVMGSRKVFASTKENAGALLPHRKTLPAETEPENNMAAENPETAVQAHRRSPGLHDSSGFGNPYFFFTG